MSEPLHPYALELAVQHLRDPNADPRTLAVSSFAIRHGVAPGVHDMPEVDRQASILNARTMDATKEGRHPADVKAIYGLDAEIS